MTKENVKKLIPQVLKVLAFVLTFAVLLQALSVFVFSGEKVSQISKRMADSYSFLSEPENSVDVVCVGNSDIRSGFDLPSYGKSMVIQVLSPVLHVNQFLILSVN